MAPGSPVCIPGLTVVALVRHDAIRRHKANTAMLPEKKTKTNIGVGIGIILQIAGRALAATSDAGAILGLIVVLVGAAFFVWGCMNYAEGKGHSKWLDCLAFSVALASLS